MEKVEQSGKAAEAITVPRRRFNVWRGGLTNPSLITLVREIQASLRGCQTVLDVGCGSASPMRFLSDFRVIGMDGYAPAVQEARAHGTHDEYILGDVKRLTEFFPGRQFDACIALDVIEHLQKADGWQMLEDMERLATRRVIIFTPNGFIPQHSKDGDLQEHLSGWTTGELRPRGYRVIGIGGLNSLRGEYHRIKYQPRAFWSLVSLFSHYAYTASHPEKAAAIFCVKELRSN